MDGAAGLNITAQEMGVVCEHLQPVEQALTADRIKETYRGQPWTDNCREWVYFDCVLQLDVIRARFELPDCVTDHIHRGTHDGQEAGLYCRTCEDGVMGIHPDTTSARVWP